MATLYPRANVLWYSVWLLLKLRDLSDEIKYPSLSLPALSLWLCEDWKWDNTTHWAHFFNVYRLFLTKSFVRFIPPPPPLFLFDSFEHLEVPLVLGRPQKYHFPALGIRRRNENGQPGMYERISNNKNSTVIQVYSRNVSGSDWEKSWVQKQNSFNTIVHCCAKSLARSGQGSKWKQHPTRNSWSANGRSETFGGIPTLNLHGFLS